MKTELEIRAVYKAMHDNLSANYYSGLSGWSKAEFDKAHGQVWADMDQDLIAGGFKQPPIPPRDFAAELDDLQERVKKLELL